MPLPWLRPAKDQQQPKRAPLPEDWTDEDDQRDQLTIETVPLAKAPKVRGAHRSRRR